MEITYTIKSNDKYITIKELLKSKFQVSDRLLTKLKKSNKIYLNEATVGIYENLKINDTIKIQIDFIEDNSNILPTPMDLDIIFEDDAYLVINKPAGYPIHPSMDHYTDSISNGLKYYFDTKNIQKKIRPVNRLDKDTSGIVIFAKNEYIQECLIKQMQKNIFQKEYIAICNGFFENKDGTITAPISRKENSIIERCVNPNGDIAITHYNVIKEFKQNDFHYSSIKCKIETGRTHQIRVHMSYIGHSILSDTLYGSSSPLINRQALHSYKTSFIHPITQKEVTYIANIPKDIITLIK